MRPGFLRGTPGRHDPQIETIDLAVGRVVADVGRAGRFLIAPVAVFVLSVGIVGMRGLSSDTPAWPDNCGRESSGGPGRATTTEPRRLEPISETAFRYGRSSGRTTERKRRPQGRQQRRSDCFFKMISSPGFPGDCEMITVIFAAIRFHLKSGCSFI